MAEQPITAELVLEKLRHHRLDWAQRFHVVALVLFGSLARGTARHQSDIDIWVRLDPLTPYALVHLKHDLEELLPEQREVLSGLLQVLNRAHGKSFRLLEQPALLHQEEGKDALM